MIGLKEILCSDTDDSDSDDLVTINKPKVKSRKPSAILLQDWFIKGPIAGSWISKVCTLSTDHIVNVGLAIVYANGIQRKGSEAVLDRFIFNRFDVKKDSARRALDRLEKAGLVEYVRVGKRFMVTILPVEPGDSTGNNQSASLDTNE